MRNVVLAVMLMLLAALAWPADLPTPTTTLAAETANNTSAAPAFLSQADGNAAGANISKRFPFAPSCIPAPPPACSPMSSPGGAVLTTLTSATARRTRRKSIVKSLT